MEKIKFDDDIIIEAVRLWVGKNKGGFPNQNDQRVIKRFGPEHGAQIIEYIKILKESFYQSEAWLRADSLSNVAIFAKDDFLRQHPDVPEEVADLFAWCYSFSYR